MVELICLECDAEFEVDDDELDDASCPECGSYDVDLA